MLFRSDWKPLFNFLDFIFFKDPFISTNLTIEFDDIISKLLDSITKISFYFDPNEIDEIVHLFLPHISSYGKSNFKYSILFCYFLPIHKRSYQKWINQIIELFKDVTSTDLITVFCILLNKIFLFNIFDDFTDFLQIIIGYIKSYIIHDKIRTGINVEDQSGVFNFLFSTSLIGYELARSIVFLCISPSTSKKSIELISKLLNFSVYNFHPSSKDVNISDNFLIFIERIIYLLFSLKSLSSKKFSYFPEEIFPKIEILNPLLKSIVSTQLFIMDRIHSKHQIKVILTLLKLDSSFFHQYFRYAIQNIKNNDVLSLSISGWNILTSLMTQINFFPQYLIDLENILILAIDALSFNDLRIESLQFFYSFFSHYPFSNNENIPFNTFNISQKFIICLFEIAKLSPSIYGKTSN